jgi:tetratricopeptide (TPR) repeat protein/predicted Ser/Thr protein kinase
VDKDDQFGRTERIPAGLETSPDGQNLDRELIKANVMAGLFKSLVEPTRMGRFSLITRIGTGAMGEVYAAYDEQLDRKVAIKLVRPDAASGSSQRLLREAQVLARLSHPNVVQVYEAGTIGDRVFLAMEFIRGQTLRQWLIQQAELPEPKRWRSVLAMFLAAGRGLQAAHAAGLVHRDFKPDNVLVGSDGRVCVADFGLARLAPGNPSTEDTWDATPDPSGRASSPRPTDVLTRNGAVMGTPAYMSPEQWGGRPIDARSDQFSFCVALYEALYGARPFGDENRTLIQKRVLAGEYRQPPDATAVPARIWTVLQRGLALAPADRYPDMGTILDALAADPRHRWRHRVVKALLLASGALAGAGLALQAASGPARDSCALAGASVTSIWNPEVAGEVHRVFTTSGVPYAMALWNILEPRIDEYAAMLQEARQAACTATYTRHEQSEDIFDLVTLCLDRRERHLKALRGQLVRADASTIEHSAEAVAALPRIEACEESEDLVLGLQPPVEAEEAAVRAIQDQLARIHLMQLSGQHQQALEQAPAQVRAAGRLAYLPVRAEALHQLGVLWREGGSGDQVARAEATLKEALDLAESHHHDELVNQIWLDLLLLARRHHTDYTLAHEWARRAMATSYRLRSPGQQRQQRSAALSLRGALHAQQGELALAEEDQRAALQLLSDQPGAPPLARARRLHALANTLLARGRVAEARVAFEESLTLRKAELGDSHPGIARLSYDMALALRESGELTRARELLGQALAIWTAVHGPVNLDVADARLALANLAETTGDLDVAADHARLAREIYRQVVPADSPRQAYPEAAVALIASRRGHFTEALAGYERALAAQERAVSPNPVHLALFQSNIAAVLVDLGRPDEALHRIARAEALLAPIGGVLPRHAASVHRIRGLALLAQGHARAATAPLERALELLSATSGKPAHSMERAETEWALARALRRADRRQEARARALARSAHAVFQERGPAAEPARQAIDAWLAAAP